MMRRVETTSGAPFSVGRSTVSGLGVGVDPRQEVGRSVADVAAEVDRRRAVAGSARSPRAQRGERQPENGGGLGRIEESVAGEVARHGRRVRGSE